MNIQILQQSIVENQILVNNAIDTIFVTRFINGMLRIPTEILYDSRHSTICLPLQLH